MPSTTPSSVSSTFAQACSDSPRNSSTVAAKPVARPVTANETTSATPSPSSDSRSTSSRRSNGGGSGTFPHCSESASRRFVIHPIPEYSAISRPIAPTVPADWMAVSTMPFSVSPSSPGTALVIESWSLASRSGCARSTNPAMAKAIISSGTSDSTLKYVMAAA